MMTSTEWVMVAVGTPTILLGLLGYLRNPVLISAASAEVLRREIKKLQDDNSILRAENAACRAEGATHAARIAYLESVVETLRSSEDWWQGKCRRLETEIDRLSRRWPEQHGGTDPVR